MKRFLLRWGLALILIIALMIVGLLKLFRKIFRFRVSAKKYDEMVKQVRTLQRDLMRANYEKDKLLQMRMAELGGGIGQEPPEEPDEDQNGEVPEDYVKNLIFCLREISVTV